MANVNEDYISQTPVLPDVVKWLSSDEWETCVLPLGHPFEIYKIQELD